MLGKGTGIFSDTKGKVKVAVCSNCREISIYFDKIEKIEQQIRILSA